MVLFRNRTLHLLPKLRKVDRTVTCWTANRRNTAFYWLKTLQHISNINKTGKWKQAIKIFTAALPAGKATKTTVLSKKMPTFQANAAVDGIYTL